jgi:flavin-dependent dehydrogenase
MLDALIIGGGPAGASAALLLARAGRSVAVVEKSAFPRRKVCGEYVAAPAASFLRSVGLPLDAEMRRVALWAGERVIEARLPAPYASTLAREYLDTKVLELAARAGAAVFQPLKALSLTRTASGFLCETPSIKLQARTVIAAHGSWEPGTLPTQQRRAAGRPADLLAFKTHFRGTGLSSDTIALAPFPGGYGGVLMLGDGRATYACCLRRDALESLRRPGLSAGESVFRHALNASTGLREAFAGARRDGAWLASGPLRAGVRSPYRDGIFAVGNAAGEVHPVVGQGIGLAIQSARLLVETLDTPAEYARRCRRLYARALWPSALIARLVPHARMPWLLSVGAKVVVQSLDLAPTAR